LELERPFLSSTASTVTSRKLSADTCGTANSAALSFDWEKTLALTGDKDAKRAGQN
jgi:hypothetical protein